MKTFPKPLSQMEEKECLERCKGGDQSARNMLIEHNMRLVAHVVKKYQGVDEETDDLISIGTIGLIKAIDHFDLSLNLAFSPYAVPMKGSKLATYAARCVENEVLMKLRSNKKLAREVSLYEPIGVDKDGETVSLMDVIEMENPETIDGLILDQDIREMYRAFDRCLTDPEKQVISMRYGLFRGREHTQREIAARMGISRSYV